MDIDSKVNMSLDEIVRQNSKKRNNRRNGNGNKRSIKSRLSTANNVKKSITRGNINGKWKHDLFSSSNSSNSKRSIIRESEKTGRIQKRLSRKGLLTAKRVAGLTTTTPKRKQTSTIQIANLHPNANTEDIKTIFQEFGEIVNILLKRDINGNSTGVCEIEYANRKSSIDAIAKYNGIIADGQKLSVAEIQKSFSIAGVSNPNSNSQKSKISVKGMYADRISEQKKPSIISHGNSKTKFHITI
jgi:RNA recognition motif-containing protein